MCADFTTHEYPPHTHEALVVAVTEQGGSVVRSRGQVEEAHPSTLFVFNPAEPHAGWMGGSRRWQYRSMYLAQPALDRVALGLGIDSVPYFTRNLFRDPDLIEGFLAMHRALEEGRDVFRERELLIAAFGTLFRRHGSGGRSIRAAPRDRVLLKRVTARMHAEFASDLSLDALAESVGLTVFQLIGLFKRTVGLTPHAYLTQVRLGIACRQLQRAQSPAEVAAAVGFYDQSALNKHFKRCYGITPLQFARAAAA
ncbi:MAG: AraC family transcriptional regulator [Proteobacteria bacterium]|nr:AraC family transcriptional regulator [Pseudomonadota bacterium]